MALTHTTAVRSSVASAVLASIDAGGAAGKLVFQTSAGVAVATLTLSYPCGTVSNGILTFGIIDSDINAAGGAITKFKITTSANADVIFGAVSIFGSDINLQSVTITSGDTVGLSSLLYSAPV